MSMKSNTSASVTPRNAEQEDSESVVGTTTKFTLKNWRIWAASFGFFWTLFVCGVLSMYSFKYAGGGSELMKEEIEMLGPVRKTDVEKAQLNIIGILRKLEESGEIVIGGGGDDLV